MGDRGRKTRKAQSGAGRRSIIHTGNKKKGEWMGLRINGITSAQTAGRRLGESTERMNRYGSHLSSGSRIASAADDASGLGIAQAMRARERGMSVASRNVQDGLSMLQTASAGMEGVGSALDRMRELAVQAASGSLSAEDRVVLDTEFQANKDEIDRLASETSFNGRRLLDGTGAGTEIQAGVDSGETIDVDLPDATYSDLDSLDLSTASGASAALAEIDAAIEETSAQQGELGAVGNRLEGADRSLQASRVEVARAESRISDAEIAV
ncbi:MAG: flagellin, partial [Gammaproteobacteria bacterium]